MSIPLSNIALRNDEGRKNRLVAFIVTLRAVAFRQRTAQRFAFLFKTACFRRSAGER